MPIVVQRNGAAVPLTVKLGDFNGLGPATAIYSYELHAAWQNRLARTTGQGILTCSETVGFITRRNTTAAPHL